MGHPAPFSHSAIDPDCAESTRRTLIHAIEAHPPDVDLFRDLLRLLRFTNRRAGRRRAARPDALHDQARGCLWLVHLGSWVTWLL